MAIIRERHGAPITFECDNCYDIDETHCEDFQGALLKIRSHNWKVTKASGEWQHFCKDCADE